MKVLFLCLCINLAAVLSAGAHPSQYQSTPLKNLGEQNAQIISKGIEKFVLEQSHDYSGPGAGIYFEYSCNQGPSFKIFCSFFYSDGGGMTGVGVYELDQRTHTGKVLKYLRD